MKTSVRDPLLCALLVLTLFGATAPGQEKKAEPRKALLEIDFSQRCWDLDGMALSADGKRIVTGHFSGYGNSTQVCVWDAVTGKNLLDIPEAHNTRGSCRAVAFSPDGKRILGGGDSPVTKVWDAQTGKELLVLEHSADSAAFTPDGKRIVTGSRWDSVIVWDAETGKQVFNLDPRRPADKEIRITRATAVSPDGKRIARAGSDNKILIWDAETGKELLHFPAKAGMHLAFSPDSKHIVSAYTGRVLQLYGERIDDATLVTVWDAATGKELLALEHAKGESFTCAAFSSDGKWIVAGGYDQTEKTSRMKVWDAATGKGAVSFSPKTSPAVVSFTPDGKRIVTAVPCWSINVFAFDKP